MVQAFVRPFLLPWPCDTVVLIRYTTAQIAPKGLRNRDRERPRQMPSCQPIESQADVSLAKRHNCVVENDTCGTVQKIVSAMKIFAMMLSTSV